MFIVVCSYSSLDICYQTNILKNVKKRLKPMKTNTKFGELWLLSLHSYAKAHRWLFSSCLSHYSILADTLYSWHSEMPQKIAMKPSKLSSLLCFYLGMNKSLLVVVCIDAVCFHHCSIKPLLQVHDFSYLLYKFYLGD